MDEILSIAFLMSAATLRVATPLILCAMGGLFSEKSGIIDVGLEGKMLMAAFFAAATASMTGSAWAGVGAGVIAAEVLALLHGFACITHRGNQVVSGVAINILAAGLTIVLGNAWFKQGGLTPPLTAKERLMPLVFPNAGDSILVYVALLAVPFTWWLVGRTRFGLRLRAVGRCRSRSMLRASRSRGCAIVRCCCAGYLPASPALTSRLPRTQASREI